MSTGKLTTHMVRRWCVIAFLTSGKRRGGWRHRAARTVAKVHEMQQENLAEKDVTGYRSMAPTAHYVAVDRPDQQYTTSVLMRRLETPLTLQEMPLMGLASFLNAVPELRWDFQYQEMPDEVHVKVDSDWTQCPRTPRSAGCGLVFQQQHTISLSSVHKVATGTAPGLIRNERQAMELKATVRVGTDSSAAAGITRRLGWSKRCKGNVSCT